MSVDAFLLRLDKVRRTGSGKWLACCPAHRDKNPSMSVGVGDDGRVLVHCFSQGCSVEDIAGAVGMTVAELMPENIGFIRAKPLKYAVQPRDALFAIRDDLATALIYAKDMQRGYVLTQDDSLKLAKIIGRVQMAITLSGGE